MRAVFFEGTLWAGTHTKKVFREDGENGGVVSHFTSE